MTLVTALIGYEVSLAGGCGVVSGVQALAVVLVSYLGLLFRRFSLFLERLRS